VITNDQFWEVLSRIDGSSRARINKKPSKVSHGSERGVIIRGEVPYNPAQIMREASRLAFEAGVKHGEMWSLDSDGASVGDVFDAYSTNFYCPRPKDSDDGDGDKYCALHVLAKVCEYVRKRNER
jgi:hypothetical protein